jgi:hypothetical protein
MTSNPPEKENKFEDVEQTVSKSVESAATSVGSAAGKLTKDSKPGNLNLDTLKEQPWQEWLDTGSDILSKVPEYIGNFFSDYSRPLVSLLLIAAAIVTVYITLAVLGAIDDIPLLTPVLKLVGMGYTAWFVYRYLWKAENRQELRQEFESFYAQIVGRNDTTDI